MDIILKSLAIEPIDLDKINKFTNRTFTIDELYTFSVILCDNEVDRDFERFDDEALLELSKQFIGKTGIFDHNVSGKNQTARIFDAEFITDSTKITTRGERYSYVKAKAYMVKNDKTNDLMLEIDGGIKKEVSVSCSIKSAFCSVCGTDQREKHCSHVKGKIYNKEQCYHILSEVKDVYEWSFVAVPAQKNAGVTKSYRKMEVNTMSNKDYQSLTKAFMECDDCGISLSKKEADLLSSKLHELEKASQIGYIYRNDLINEVKRLSFLNNEDIPAEIISSVAEKMDICELKAFKQSYENKINHTYELQLSKNDTNSHDTAAFKL